MPVQLSIYRYNPQQDTKPYMQSFELSLKPGEDKMLLAVLLMLQEQQDGTLTFRRSCGEGVCGSDGMNINGKNGLACMTPLSSLKEPIVIRPLPGLPVIKDLVVDMEPFYTQNLKTKPYLINDQPPPLKERLQSPQEREKLDGLYECIDCGCCTSACPSYWWNPKEFLGPAALLKQYRFYVDSRDNAKEERLAALNDHFSLLRCRTIMNCATVCPKGLNPAKAIAKLRDSLLEEEI